MPPKHMIKLEDSPSGYVRPSIVNEEDIRAMDAEDVEDGGWAGAQEEIDYSVKLNFDDDEAPSAGDHGGRSSGRETKQADPVSEPPQHQGERVVNGQTNKAQVCCSYVFLLEHTYVNSTRSKDRSSTRQCLL